MACRCLPENPEFSWMFSPICHLHLVRGIHSGPPCLMTFNPMFIKILSYKNKLFSEITMTHDYPINYIFHVGMDFYHLQYIHYYNP